MCFIESKLTIKKVKMIVFLLKKILKKSPVFIKNAVLRFCWCKNYTIGNFTNM